MRRRETQRVPLWVSFVAPVRVLGPVFIVSWALGAVATEILGGPFWVPVVAAGLVSGLADIWWRRSKPPSDDASWSLVARLLYRRKRSE
jgi:hypothetical protein